MSLSLYIYIHNESIGQEHTDIRSSVCSWVCFWWIDLGHHVGCDGYGVGMTESLCCCRFLINRMVSMWEKEKNQAEAHHRESLACTPPLMAEKREEPCGAPKAKQKKLFPKQQTIMGCLVTLHGQSLFPICTVASHSKSKQSATLLLSSNCSRC